MNFQSTADEIGISIEAYTRLCSLFLETTRGDLETLSSAIAGEDREEIRSLAHHIKGAASNMDFSQLMEEAEKLQHGALTAPRKELHRLEGRIYEHFHYIEQQLGENH